MPQLILEFSSNVIEKNDNFGTLFRDCHLVLEKIISSELASCKARAIECGTYYVGDGDEKNAFVHLTLKVMPGRTPQILQKLGDEIMGLLRNYFAQSLKQLNLQITLEIIELQKTYFKIKSE